MPGSATPRRLRMHCEPVQRWKGCGETDEGNWNGSGKQKRSLTDYHLDSLWEILYPFVRGLSHDLDAFVHPSGGF